MLSKSDNTNKVYAIIPAGGQGKRTGESLPKQYHKINGKEIIAFTLEAFERNQLIDEIVVAAMPEYFPQLRQIASKYNISKLKDLAEGGRERQDSVFNALSIISPDDRDLICVHDAARPLISQNIITTAVKTAETFDNAVVCIKARDTLLKAEEGLAGSYLDRNEIYYVQTPQVFRYNVLKHSMDLAFKKHIYGTDESMLVVSAGYKVQIVEGSPLNFKITSREDFDMFRGISPILQNEH